ncbi:helix-turn-helix domain-containing protein [Streptomyces decoyicus]|uniref:helix-turn-helix domain-containing protein n=1 Tax=Streptomyces decoyicus TaxID=249567 RepID=UPI0036283C2C
MGEERDTDEPFGGSGGYRERVSRLAGAVLWTRTTLSARPVPPDGCMDLIWSGGRLPVAGPGTGPHLPGDVVSGALSRGPGGRGGAPIVGLRFAPGQGPAVFGVPARELRDQRVPLADLWPAGRVRELAGRLAEAGAADSGSGVGRLLEETAAVRLRDGTTTARLRDATATGGPMVALSERQLHRLSPDAFGYGPKTLTRVLRLVRALDLARSGMPYAQVAVRAGYADQAHLAREVKSPAGAPMGVLLAPG